MALVYINGHMYYTKSVRHGGRVTSECWASGEVAMLFAQMDTLIQEEKQALRCERRELERQQTEARRARKEESKSVRERLDSTDRAMIHYSQMIGTRVDTILADLGYHRPNRSKWRRRRKPVSNELAEPSVQELTRLAREGDQIALNELAYHASRALKPPDPYSGELARTIVEPMLLDLVAPKYDLLRDAVAAKLEAVRRDLTPRGSSMAERLLAERAVFCWLHVLLLERDRAESFQNFEAGHEVNFRKITMVDQSLSRAQARLERSLIALGKIRRLKLPNVINQVNVGAQVNGVQMSAETNFKY
jgi:hypothetical protein